MEKIDILLATYNGEKYIAAQIYSILTQTLPNWRLIIHDDGSTDGTLRKIKEIQKHDDRIHIIEDNIICGGAANNFLHLLRNSSQSEYVIFCDQDDIWFENKLEVLVKGFDSGKPMAIFCNGYSFSPDRGIISDHITAVYPEKLEDQLFLNAGIQGCSLMFNRALLDKMTTIPAHQAMHDHFITLFAICFGKLGYVDYHVMLYRQFHENKATANINKSQKARIFSLFVSDIPVIDRKHFIAVRSFYESYKNQLNDAQISLFLAYFAYADAPSLFKKLSIVWRNKFNIYGKISLLLLKTITRKTIN